MGFEPTCKSIVKKVCQAKGIKLTLHEARYQEGIGFTNPVTRKGKKREDSLFIISGTNPNNINVYMGLGKDKDFGNEDKAVSFILSNL